MSSASHNAAPAAPGKFLKNVLGIIFFVVLIIEGILIAVYGARTIPGLFKNGTGASVYSSSVFQSGTSTTQTTATQPTTGTTNGENGSVGQTINSVIQNGLSTPALPKAPAIAEPTGTTPTTTTAPKTTGRYIQVPVQYSGLSDLTVNITEIGYLDSRNRFVESDTIPSNRLGVVRFVVFNGGTNASGQWRLEAELPTNQDYRSQYQAGILPGGSSVGELFFDNADEKRNQDIVIVVDSSNNVQESNERNNTARAEVDID